MDKIAVSNNYDVSTIKGRWQDLKNTIKGVGIYSMALDERDYPNNNLLWSLYAGEYAGFCVAYDIDKLLQNEQFPWLVNRIFVNYQKNIPVVDVTDVSSEKVLLQKMLGTKGADWEREREFRLVYDKSGVKSYNRAALKAIYIGFRMTEKHRQRIVEGLQGRDVAIYEMTPLPDSYDFNARLSFSLHRKIENALKENEYKIIDSNHKPKVENFYVLFKGTDRSDENLLSFVKKFREMYATMDANVELYDSEIVKPLLKKYPLSKVETKIMREHFIGMSSFDVPNDIIRCIFD
ncbi:MAG: DUF2971 domain-containing protein [Prevotella sp.]